MKPVMEEISVQAWARLVRAQQLLLERVETDLKRAGLPPLRWYPGASCPAIGRSAVITVAIFG